MRLIDNYRQYRKYGINRNDAAVTALLERIVFYRCKWFGHVPVITGGADYKFKCSQIVKKAPLTKFKIDRHGRKWKQSARSLKGYVLHLSLNANNDGTFTRKGINYSPSYKTLCETFAPSMLWVYENEARELGIVSWTRTDHYDRREYVIHLSKLLDEESHSGFDAEHTRDSKDAGNNTLGIQENTLGVREEHARSASVITHSATKGNPSLGFPSSTANPLPSSAAGWLDTFAVRLGGKSCPNGLRAQVEARMQEPDFEQVANRWLNREMGTATLKQPWSVFLKEFDMTRAVLKQEQPTAPVSEDDLQAHRELMDSMYGTLDAESYRRKLAEAEATLADMRDLLDDENLAKINGEIERLQRMVAEFESKEQNT